MRKSPTRKCSVDGVEYESVVECAAALNIGYKNARSRFANERYPSWKLLGEPTRTNHGVRGTTFVIFGEAYNKRSVAAAALGLSESYISILINDPVKLDCYRILADGTTFKDVERHKARKEQVRKASNRRYHQLQAEKGLTSKRTLGRPKPIRTANDMRVKDGHRIHTDPAASPTAIL